MKSFLMALSCLACVTSTQAQETTPAHGIQLLLDAETSPPMELPWDVRYRSMKTPFSNPEGSLNPQGMHSVRAAASMQFSASDFVHLIAQIQKDYPEATAQKIWVFDLREEFHGFIQGCDVYWRRSPQNDANAGIAHESLSVGEDRHLQAFFAHKKLVVSSHIPWKETTASLERPKGNSTFVLSTQEVETERSLVQRFGAHYVRIPVTDHTPPSPDDVDLFITYLKDLPKDAVMLFHCQGGYGRTTTFMALTDIWINHHQATCAEILARQAALPYALDLRAHHYPGQTWKEAKSRDRQRLVEQFYEYVHTPGLKAASTFREFTLKKMFESRP